MGNFEQLPNKFINFTVTFCQLLSFFPLVLPRHDSPYNYLLIEIGTKDASVIQKQSNREVDISLIHILLSVQRRS